NFDFLRHADGAPGNINDFLMLNYIEQLNSHNIGRLNMGLSALAGLEDSQADTSPLLNSFLSFIYESGDRFFAFRGLNRFKSKYQPEWQDRFVVYRGGLAGFGRTMNALMRAM